MARAELKAIISADARAFYRQMSQVGNGTKIALAMIGGAGVGAAAAWAKATTALTTYGDDIAKAAKRTGISTDAMQRFSMAAKLSGTSMEGLETGVRRMAGVIYDAGVGLETAKRPLADLGLSFDELKDQLPEDQLTTILERLAGVTNATKRAALATDIFGRSGTMLLPMLDGGGEGLRQLMTEADRLHLIIPPEQIAAAEELNDAMDRVRGRVLAIAQAGIGKDMDLLAAALNDLALNEDLFRILSGAVSEVSAGMTGLVESVAAMARDKDSMEALANVAQGMGEGFRLVADSLAVSVPLLIQFLAILQKNIGLISPLLGGLIKVQDVVGKMKMRGLGASITEADTAAYVAARTPAPGGVSAMDALGMGGGEMVVQLRRLNETVETRLPEAG